MKKSLKLAVAAISLGMLASCQQMQPFSTETIPDAEVELSKKNYRVLATRVSGEDAGFSLLPVTQVLNGLLKIYPVGSFSVPAGIVFKAPSEAKALEQLYTKSGASKTGRATQLINVRKETGGLNAIIFGRPKIRITADLIEFCSPEMVGNTQPAQPAATTQPQPAAEQPAATPAKPTPKAKKARRGRRR